MNIIGIEPLIAAIREILCLRVLTIAIQTAWDDIMAPHKLFCAKTCESAHRNGAIISVEV